MPPEIKDSEFIKAFYEMKSDIRSINEKLDNCSLTKGQCAEHHDYITAQTAANGTMQSIIIKTSALTGIITGLLTLLFKVFKVF